MRLTKSQSPKHNVPMAQSLLMKKDDMISALGFFVRKSFFTTVTLRGSNDGERPTFHDGNSDALHAERSPRTVLPATPLHRQLRRQSQECLFRRVQRCGSQQNSLEILPCPKKAEDPCDEILQERKPSCTACPPCVAAPLGATLPPGSTTSTGMLLLLAYIIRSSTGLVLFQVAVDHTESGTMTRDHLCLWIALVTGARSGDMPNSSCQLFDQ